MPRRQCARFGEDDLYAKLRTRGFPVLELRLLCLAYGIIPGHAIIVRHEVDIDRNVWDLASVRTR